MKKLIALLLALVMVIGLVACGNTPANDDTTTANNDTTAANNDNTDNNAGGQKLIAVVAKGESHAFWQAVKAGAEAAGAEKGYTVTFSGPPSESPSDIPNQIDKIQTALSNNPSGLVLATIGEGFVDLLTQAYDKNLPVVQFDSGIWAKDVEALNTAGKNPILAGVATSNTAAAGVAAENFFNAIKADIAASDGYVVGIIQHDETATGIDRAGGFETKFKELADADATTAGKYTIVKEVKPGDSNNAYVDALEALFEKNANAIFMSNEGVVKQVYDAIQAAPGKYDAIKFCGFDAGTKQIQWIRATSGPVLVGSVAQDSFNIGYNSVMQCIIAVEGGTAEDVAIAGAWYDATNIDDMIANNLVYEG